MTVFFSEIFQYIVIKAARAQYVHDDEKRVKKVMKKMKTKTEYQHQHQHRLCLGVADSDDGYGDYCDDDEYYVESDSGDLENQREFYFRGKGKSLTLVGIKGRKCGHMCRSIIFCSYSRIKGYVEQTTIGRYLIVLLPFILLLLLGSVVVGCIEGWSAIDSLYWAVVTLTTVGMYSKQHVQFFIYT